MTLRVLVVGAGIAGLSAARALSVADVEVVVLEARDRIGGRLHTVEVDGHPADLGGAWIHHPEDDNLISAWVEEAGVPWIVDPTGTRFTGADLAERRVLTADELADTGYAVFEPLTARIAAAQAAGEADTSAATAIDRFLAEQPDDAVRARLRQLMAAMIEQDASGPLEEISATWALTGDMLVGDVVDNVPVDGYRSVLAPLATGLDLRLGHPVRRIVQTDDGVTVHGDDWSETGTHVIVTVPLGVLQAGSISFDPPLPPERRAVIDRTGFGTMDKVVLAFPEPFWRAIDPGLQHSVIYPADRTEAATWTWDFGLSPTVMFLVAQSAVPTMLRDPRRWAVEQLEAVYGGPLPMQPSGWVHTDWAADEFARGAYAHIRTGQDASDFDALGTPVGRIGFAGEHTDSARQGYADGAMASGLREARRIVGDRARLSR